MNKKQPIDLLVTASWVIPVIPKKAVYQDYAIAINQQKIVGLCPLSEAKQNYHYSERVDLSGQVVMPGLINAHGHIPMSLFRGMADDYELMTWLKQYIWPAEQKWLSEAFVHDGAQLAMAEMLLSGTTCFHDMYLFPEATAQISDQVGMRTLITPVIFDFPSAWGAGPDDYIAKALNLFSIYKDSPFVSIGFGPHAPYTVGDKTLERVAETAEKLDMIVQMHVHETADEVETAIKETGLRPLQRLQKLGLLSSRFQAVHMTQIDEVDIPLLMNSGSHVIHCPESNLKLASGFCPTHQLMEAGVNVALGSDGAASNNDLDLFGELKTAALIAKAVTGDATALDAHTALSMATVNGAVAMGISDKVGSIEVGKEADLIAVDLSHVSSQPVYDPASLLVYGNCGHKVSHVWIAGQCQVKEGELTHFDWTELCNRAQSWQQKIVA